MQSNRDYLIQQQHQLNMRRAADKYRLIRLSQANRRKRNFYGPMLARLGRQMSHLGQRLERAYEPSNEVLAGAFSQE
jgi:hypothetical protein